MRVPPVLLLASTVTLLAPSAQAHICILAPAQRGGYNVTEAGDHTCYLRKAYCGGVPAPVTAPKAVYVAGQPATVTFEQNLNHWYPSKPGFFDVALSYKTDDPVDSDFVVLAKLPDFAANEMVTRTILDIPVTFPAQPCSHCILRLRYVSHNPMEVDPPDNTDAVFFNCADIALVSAPPSAHEAPAVVQTLPLASSARPAANPGYACTTPPSWVATLLETNAFGSVQHTLYWDAPNLRTRWDQTGSLDASGNSSFMLINDYSKPLEYVYSVKTQTCPIYGNDAFYPWEYGPNSGMIYTGQYNGIDTWAVAGDSTRQFTWATKPLANGLCQPVSWTRGAASVTVLDFRTGPIAPSVFTPPEVCTKKPVFAGCHIAATEALFRSHNLHSTHLRG